MQRLVLVATLLAFPLLANTASAQVLDRLYPATGSPIDGKVVKITPTEITLSRSGDTTNFAVNEIKGINFADDPNAMQAARTSLRTGQYSEALDQLERIDPKEATREFSKVDLEYYIAFCKAKLALAGKGDPTEAAGAVAKFYKANPTSYHHYEAAEIFGDLAMATGNYPFATTYYSELSKAPWDDYKLKGAILEAKPLLASKKFPEALKKYEEVIASPVNTTAVARQKLLAGVMRARCLGETGKGAEGLKFVDDVIAKNDSKDVELFAAAYIARGACNAKLGNRKRAIEDYLHVDLMFAKDPDLHAESLYQLSKLWVEDNKGDLSVKMRNKLQQTYPTSQWSKAK